MRAKEILAAIYIVVFAGIAIPTIILFWASSAAFENRETVKADLTNFAARAQQYYQRPLALGGGGNSFAGLTPTSEGIKKLTSRPINDHGAYEILLKSPHDFRDFVVLCGTGVERGNDGVNPIKYQIEVFPDSVHVVELN